MRRTASLMLLSLLLLTGGAAIGDEKPAPGRPKPPSPQQAAQEVEKAHKAEDAATLKALAAQGSPDPWLVADILCSQDAFDAADAFARAAPRTLVEKLPGYVAAQRKKGSKERRTLLATMIQALRAGKPQAVLDAAERMQGEPDDVPGIRIAQGRGFVLERLGRREECIVAYSNAAQAALRLGWYERAGRSFLDAGYVALQDKDWPTAQTHFEAMLAIALRIGIQSAAAGAHRNLGVAFWRQGRHATALLHMQKALAIYESLEAEADASHVSDNVGRILRESGDVLAARDHYEGSLREARVRKDRKAEARALIQLCLSYEKLGDYPRALGLVKRGHAIAQELRQPELIRKALMGLAIVHCAMGDYPRALAHNEQALALAEKLEDPKAVLSALANLGAIYGELREHARALRYFERGLAAAEAQRDPTGIAVMLANIGSVHAGQGDLEKALVLYHRSLRIAESIDYGAGRRLALSNIGLAYARSGRLEKAQEWIGKYLRHAEETGDRLSAATAQAQLGGVHDELGDYVQAVQLLRKAVRTFERLRATRHLVHYLADLARVFLGAGHAIPARAAARRAMPHLESLLGGLGEEEASTARSAHVRLFSLGTLASRQLGEPAEALYFLESGRAGALLESLGGRATLRWDDLPEELHSAETAAKTAEFEARRDHALARRSGSLAQARAATQALDLALDRQREVAARIQREAKRQAGLYYPRAATLEEIQDWMDERTALVLYGICEQQALALVLTKKSARFVSLGAAGDLPAVCAALRLHTESVPVAEAARALAEGRRRLVTPLALPAGVERVLVSPVGPLSYVPFPALFEQPIVACVPSGTTWVLLKEEARTSGAGVLALGDPEYGTKADPAAVAVYRGGLKLAALPGTREEARSVGSVVLLGAEATEAGLRTALAQRDRWRAVHLACHGLVDPERPVLSSLALTQDGEEDGFLTALEVLRMRMPADLAVLSACETGKGKIVGGEGILGLTRAFMYAGAERVLCSLWKVDDEATRALMVKFYELWRQPAREGVAGVSAAAALKRAQEYVKTQEKWEHPYYWAAWVLWGLDD